MTRYFTSSDVRKALGNYYSQPEWAILFEVINATGASHSRSCDAIAMSLWPSRGLHLHGMEIKVSRSDWLSELKNPAKADVFYGLVDYWWLVTPEGIVKDGELPTGWGHIIVKEDGKIQHKVQAVFDQGAPISTRFMAALMRAMDKSVESRAKEMVADERNLIKEKVNQEVEYQLSRRTPNDFKAISIKYQSLLTEIGLTEEDTRLMGWQNDMADIGHTYRILKNCGINGVNNHLLWMVDSMASNEKKLREGLIKSGVINPPETKSGRKK